MKRTIALAAWLLLWVGTLVPQTRPINQDSIGKIIKETWELLHKDRDKAREQAEDILTFSGQNDYKEGLAESNAIFGVLAMHEGKWSVATNYLEQSDTIWQELGNEEKLGNIKLKLAAVKNWQGHYEEAFAYLTQAKTLLKETTGRPKAYEYVISGNQLMDARDLVAAKDRYFQALQIFEEEADSMGIAIAKYELGNLNYYQNNYDEATKLINESQEFFQAENNIYYLSLSKNVLGAIHLDRDSFDRANAAFQQSIQYAAMIGDSLLQFDAYINKSVVAYYEKDYQKALQQANIAAQVLGDKGGIPDKKYLVEHYADIYREMGKYKLSNQYLDSVIELNNAMYNEAVAEAKEAFKRDSSKFLNRLTQLSDIKEENLQLKDSIADLEQKALNELFLRRLATVVSVFLALLVIAMLYSRKFRRKAHFLLLKQRELLHQKEIGDLVLASKAGTARAHLEGQEEERQRIARVLHDRLGSKLAAIRWSLEANIDEQTASIALSPVESTLKALEETHKDLRGLVRDLERNKYDLEKQVRDFLDYIGTNKKIETNLHTFGLSDELDVKLSEFAFDIILQLIANALEHASPTKLDVEINKLEDELNIIVEDDGKGFSPEEIMLNGDTGHGLKNIESSISKRNGTFQVDSKKGKGATINITIPIK